MPFVGALIIALIPLTSWYHTRVVPLTRKVAVRMPLFELACQVLYLNTSCFCFYQTTKLQEGSTVTRKRTNLCECL